MFVLIVEIFEYKNGKVTSLEKKNECFNTYQKAEDRLDRYLEVYAPFKIEYEDSFTVLNIYDSYKDDANLVKKFYLQIIEVEAEK